MRYNSLDYFFRAQYSRDWFTLAPRDQRIEAQLFGAQLSGINFDKYEDIPVEASGNDCPTAIDSVRIYIYIYTIMCIRMYGCMYVCILQVKMYG